MSIPSSGDTYESHFSEAQEGKSSIAPLGKGARVPLSDTHPEAEKVMIEGYRRMPGWQKLQQVTALTQMVNDLALADIRHRHPNAEEEEVRMRLASRWLSPELMRRVYGWDPDREGY